MKLKPLLESTIDYLINFAVSNKTEYWLDERYKNDFNIDFAQAVYFKDKNFLELIFFANSTYGAEDFISATDVFSGAKNGQYTLALRFYDVNNFLSDIKSKDYKAIEFALKEVFHKCNVKFYSDDPSFFYQNVWLNLEKNDLSIYKFPGPNGTGEWDTKHYTTSGIHLTKHLVQICKEIDTFIRNIAQNLKIR